MPYLGKTTVGQCVKHWPVTITGPNIIRSKHISGSNLRDFARLKHTFCNVMITLLSNDCVEIVTLRLLFYLTFYHSANLPLNNCAKQNHLNSLFGVKFSKSDTYSQIIILFISSDGWRFCHKWSRPSTTSIWVWSCWRSPLLPAHPWRLNR